MKRRCLTTKQAENQRRNPDRKISKFRGERILLSMEEAEGKGLQKAFK